MIKDVFSIQIDNEAMALSEIKGEIRSLLEPLGAKKLNIDLKVEESHRCKPRPDWFDDYEFFISAGISSDGISERDIQSAVEESIYYSSTYDEYIND